MDTTMECMSRVYGPDEIWLDGRRGARYWLERPRKFCGMDAIDRRLSDFPVAIFQPARLSWDTPILVSLQGMAAPFQWSSFLVPTLLDMGNAVVMPDTPFGGERSLLRRHDGHIAPELAEACRLHPEFSPQCIALAFNAVADDIRDALNLASERHGLSGNRVALFGVRLGVLFCSYAFTHHGIGSRLLGCIGHADLARMAQSYCSLLPPPIRWLMASGIARPLWRVRLPADFQGFLPLLTVLNWLICNSDEVQATNPMTYVHTVRPPRTARFLVGNSDPLVSHRDADECAMRFPEGKSYLMPGSHGSADFVDHVRFFLGTQLGDWRW